MPRIGDKIIPRGRGYYGAVSTVDDKYYDSSQSDYVGCPSEKLEGTAVAVRNKVKGTVSPRDNQEQVLVFVRNVSTAVLLPSQLVTWKALFIGKRVDGHCKTDSERVAGVVDENFAASGVPVGECFWLQVKGPCLVRTSVAVSTAENTFSAGSLMCAATGANSTGIVSTTSGGKIRYATVNPTGITHAVDFANIVGRALTAATSANTGGATATHTTGVTKGLCLIDLNLY